MNRIHPRIFTLGSRPSRLARWQTEHILTALKLAWPDFHYQIVTLATQGDRNLSQPLPEIGGKGLFTAEIETALLIGDIDLAVHSLKDLPVEETPGLCIGAISRRADARDVLISAAGQSLPALPPGSRIGTSSLRREAQIRAARPDLVIQPLRGNVDTRVRKALEGDFDAVVLAAAGVERLDLGDSITEFLPFETMLPAPGQGALAAQCRVGDTGLLEILQSVHHLATSRAVTAERTFLASLGAGCSAPVAAYARCDGSVLNMDGLVASVDGRQVVRVTGHGEAPLALGHSMAARARDLGAGDLLL